MAPLSRRLRIAVAAMFLTSIFCAALPQAAPTPALAASYSSTILGDSPRVYYRLDESGCCTAADSSGNGYGATYASSGITYSAGGALIGDSDAAITTSYNGASVTRSDAFLPTGSGTRTFEVWEKTTTASVMALLSYGTPNATNQYISLNIGPAPTLSFDGWGNYVMPTPPNSLEDGNWHYIAATFDGTTAYLYVDGQQIGKGALPLATVASQGLWLGNSQDGAGAFSGSLDEAAIYSTALSASQINAHWRAGMGSTCPSVPTTGYAGVVANDHPVRYFRLGESSGSIANDYSGNCWGATYTVGASHITPGALVGDSDGAVTAPSPAALTMWGSEQGLPMGASARTIEAWEKTSVSGIFAILSYGTPTTNAYMSFNIGSAPTLSFDGWGNYVMPTPPYSLEDGKWHYIAATFDGTTAYVYVDGQQIGNGTVPLSTVAGQGFWLGKSQDGASIFPGSLDEVAIYSAALTPSQINAHWRGGMAVTCSAVPTTGYAGAVASDQPSRYFRLGEGSGIPAMDSSSSTTCRAAAYNTGVAHSPGGIIADPDRSVGSASPADLLVASSADGLPSGSTARTVEAWEKVSATGTFAILSYGTPGTNQYISLDISSTPTLSFNAYNNYVMLTSPQPLEDANWHQVAATFDGVSTATLYVDGASIGSGTLSSNTALAQGLWLGKSQDTASPFQGSLDEVAIYPTALSASRISAHYQAGAPIGGALSPAQSAGGGLNSCLPCAAAGSLRGNATKSPIDTGTGNFWHVFSDLSIAGRSYPLSFSRTYNSQSATTNSPIGYGWQFNDAISLTQNGSTVTIVQENGSQATFTQSGSTWTPSAPRFIATLTHNGDGTWTFVRQARDTYTFNASGQMVAEKDLNGYTTTLGYTSGNLTSVADPASRTLSIGWTGSHITTVTDGNVSPSRIVQFQYNDGAGNLTDMIDVNAGHWQFTYDTNHRMTVMKDPKCYATTGCPGVQNSYDASGRVQWQKDQLNRQTSFTYATNQATVTDPKGNQTVDYYNLGLRVATTKGYGTVQAATWRYGYDPGTLALIAVTDPNGNKTTYTLDGSGNPLTVTDPLGRQTTNTYNGLNQLLTSRDPNLVTTTQVYNANGNLTSVSRPLTGTSQVQTATYSYTDATHPGDVTSMVDPDNKTWAYTYDAHGNRASVTDPLGNKATTVFNADSWMTSSVAPKGNVAGCGCQSTYTTTYAHDPFGDLTTVNDPLGHQTIRHYDADQNRDWFQDGDGNRTTSVYDVANEQTQIQRPDTTTLITDYFLDGTVQDQKDGKNNAILTYGYDSLARVTSMTDALNNVTTYSYDGAGNRLTQQDPGGNCAATPKTGCTSFTYDVANQLKAITYSDGVTPNVSNIVYDSDGQRTGMTDGTGTSSWIWDSLHRLTSYTNGAGAQVQYGYNLRSLVTTLTYPGSLNVTRGYDDAGRFTSLLDWQSNTTTFGYDVNSNLTTETLPAGSGVVDTFTFDAADRLMAIADTKAGTTLFSAAYGRDNANQLTSDSSAPSSTGSYKYTTLNQVCYAGSSSTNACGSPPSGSTPYTYDAADNLTLTGATQQVFNNADELCWTASTTGSCASPPSGATTFAYDTRGNRTTVTPPAGGATNLSYDQANRLTAYGTNGTYAYNGDGLRMSKTVSGSTSQYLWDVASALPLLLKDGSTAYVHGPGGLPLEQINGSTVLWLHHDQLGSTRLATDSAGTSQATYTFDANGNLSATTGTITNPFRFGAQYRDSESSLYYLRARYYDPSTAQFITSDPAVSVTHSPYSYVAANPLNGTDPTGNGPEGFLACLGLAVPVAGEVACAAGVTEVAVTTVVAAGVWVLLQNRADRRHGPPFPDVSWQTEKGQTGMGPGRCGSLCKRIAVALGIGVVGVAAIYGDLEGNPNPQPGPQPSPCPPPSSMLPASSPTSSPTPSAGPGPSPYAPSPSP